jgi:hypothetical protein
LSEAATSLAHEPDRCGIRLSMMGCSKETRYSSV